MTIFPLQLWHGTSRHLLPMIQEHGLGGKNPMAEWKVIDFIIEAYPLLTDGQFSTDDDDVLDLLPIPSVIAGGAAGMNFEYGHVYVAGGYGRAADYAQTAPELTSHARTISRVANRCGIREVQDCLIEYPKLHDFLLKEPEPIVLKLPAVPDHWVENEKGGKVDFPTRSPKDAMIAFWSQVGFRLTHVVPSQEIEVIDASDHQYTFGG